MLFRSADFQGYMPHKEVLKMQKSSQVLLLLLNDTPNVMGVVPGKLFEYMASRRLILAIGPKEGDSARILLESEAGKVCGFPDKAAMKGAIRRYFEEWKQGELTGNTSDISAYSRRGVTGQMAGLLDGLLDK